MNHSVLWFDSIPFSLWTGISISVTETFLLYLIVASCVSAFINKNKMVLKYAVTFTFCFVSFKAFDNWQLYQQKKIIVYNIARHKAVEFIDSNNFLFTGDREVMDDKLLNSYNLKPVQIAFQLKDVSGKLNHLFSKNSLYQFYNSRILMIDSAFENYHSDTKIKINYIIISKNPKIKIAHTKKFLIAKTTFSTLPMPHGK